MSDIPKGVLLKGLEEQMYQDYKISMYAKGKTPLEFEVWREGLDDSNLSKNRKEDVSSIEFTFPEKKKTKDSNSVNDKLKEYWKEESKVEQKKEVLMFTCMKCEEPKEPSEFYKDNSARGHISICKECKKADMRRRQKELTSRKRKKRDVSKKVVTKEKVPTIKESMPPAQSETFTLTKEELIEFGKECFARGKGTNILLTKDVKESLFEKIVS